MGMLDTIAGDRPWAGAALLGVVLVFLIVTSIAAHAWKSELPLTGVRSEGNRLVASEELLKLAALPKSARLYDIDLSAVRQRVRRNPFVEQVSVRRDVPGDVTLAVQERVPVAVLASDRMYLIDAAGTVLPPVRAGEAGDLPLITGAVPQAECVPGKQIASRAVRDALLMLDMARAISDECYGRISDISVGEGETMIAHTSEFGVPVIVRREDLASQMAKFDGFWRSVVYPRGAAGLQYVDLRFEDHVVVRWN
jgi:cell division septal protein FtsQ